MSIRELSPYSAYDNSQFIEVHSGNFLLNSLLPEYWAITRKANSKLHTDPERKRIVTPENYFEKPGNFFSLLHEIGHAHADEFKSEVEIEEEIFLRDKFTHKGIITFTENEKNKYRDLVIKSEENAWNYAINTCIKLKENGIDIEPSLTSEQLILIAKQKLQSYFINS